MSKSITQVQIVREKIPYRKTSFDMVRIEGGTFSFGGSTKTTINSFYLGQYLVSQELWQEVTGSNPSFWSGIERPVERISWYDCIEFCNGLSRRMGYDPFYELDKTRQAPENNSSWDELKYWVRVKLGANGFRLPTEAEWEFAARGGQAAKGHRFSGTENLHKVSWYKENSFGKTHGSGLKLPNELGIYDMSGKLWEWCWDWYSRSIAHGPLKDPQGPDKGHDRVLRGGSWRNEEQYSRVTVRFLGYPDFRDRSHGLRLSRTV